jgi:NADH:ubiquinone oxidoreductase subunit 3 (subunit A)
MVTLTESAILSVPVVAFVLVLGFTLLLYALGRRMAPAGKKSKDKESTYACGEDVPPGNVQFYVHRFYFAVFFVIFEAAAFMIFMGINGSAITYLGWLLVLVYTFLLFIAVIAVPLWREGQEREW